MVELSKIAMDAESAYDTGRWFDVFQGFRWKLRAASSPTFQRKLAELREPHSERLSRPVAEWNDETREIERVMWRDAIAYGAATDWSDLEIDGAPVEFSCERASALLDDTRWRFLVQRIQAIIVNEDRFVGATPGALLGNLPPLLASSSNTAS